MGPAAQSAMHLPTPAQLVQQIHDSPTRIVVALSGGGRAVADLLEVPGCSRTLLEAVVPYSPPAMIAWLGGPPDEFCSAATGRAMAMVAFHRARRLDAAVAATMGPEARGQGSVREEERGEREEGVSNEAFSSHRTPKSPNLEIAKSFNPASPLVGVACTASLAASTTAAWHLELQKGRRTRAEEERLAAHIVLNAIADACGLGWRLPLELLEEERVEESRIEARPDWRELLLGTVEKVRVPPGDVSPTIVMPGAFNPVHDGHRRMMQLAREILQQPVAAEISIINVDKPPLDYIEIDRRLVQFPGDETVFLTRAATFEEKSRLFPGATFVVGVDTLRRIAAPRYYGEDATARVGAIERITSRGCRFLVFGRCLETEFIRLGDLELPDALRAICQEVPPEVFRHDVSSTAIRKAGAQ
jgi:hypothetical protein